MATPEWRTLRQFTGCARKEYTCDTCGFRIKVGELYFGTVIAYKDTRITSRDHLNCDEHVPTRQEWGDIEFAYIINMFPNRDSPFPLAS